MDCPNCKKEMKKMKEFTEKAGDIPKDKYFCAFCFYSVLDNKVENNSSESNSSGKD